MRVVSAVVIVAVVGCSIGMPKVSPTDPAPTCTESSTRPELDTVGAVLFAIPTVIGGGLLLAGTVEGDELAQAFGAIVFVPSALVFTSYALSARHGRRAVAACAAARGQVRERGPDCVAAIETIATGGAAELPDDCDEADAEAALPWLGPARRVGSRRLREASSVRVWLDGRRVVAVELSR